MKQKIFNKLNETNDNIWHNMLNNQRTTYNEQKVDRDPYQYVTFLNYCF